MRKKGISKKKFKIHCFRGRHRRIHPRKSIRGNITAEIRSRESVRGNPIFLSRRFYKVCEHFELGAVQDCVDPGREFCAGAGDQQAPADERERRGRPREPAAQSPPERANSRQLKDTKTEEGKKKAIKTRTSTHTFSST